MVNGERRETAAAGRIAVRMPNAGKVLFPGEGISKGELAGYYQRAARSPGRWRRCWRHGIRM